MTEVIDWNTQFTCHVCKETFVSVAKPKVDIEKFVQVEPCSGCGHKQWHWNKLI